MCTFTLILHLHPTVNFLLFSFYAHKETSDYSFGFSVPLIPQQRPKRASGNIQSHFQLDSEHTHWQTYPVLLGKASPLAKCTIEGKERALCSLRRGDCQVLGQRAWREMWNQGQQCTLPPEASYMAPETPVASGEAVAFLNLYSSVIIILTQPQIYIFSVSPS